MGASHPTTYCTSIGLSQSRPPVEARVNAVEIQDDVPALISPSKLGEPGKGCGIAGIPHLWA